MSGFEHGGLVDSTINGLRYAVKDTRGHVVADEYGDLTDLTGQVSQLTSPLTRTPRAPVMSTETALALRHTPVTHLFGSGVDPEDPEFVDMCELCREVWPCLIADLADMPDAHPEPIDWDALGGPFDEEAPF